jgi:hypothetical protein
MFVCCVEIKCQLDATDEFLLQILLLAQHVSGTFMPIIMSSRVLYKWLLSVVFGAWFSGCRCSVELRVVCPVCGLLQQPANRTHNSHSQQTNIHAPGGIRTHNLSMRVAKGLHVRLRGH